jgi:hypothetical protein
MATTYNESPTMKSTLTVLRLVLIAGYPLAAFAGLVGILPSSACLGREVVFFVHAPAGLAFLGLNDTGRRTSKVYAV